MTFSELLKSAKQAKSEAGRESETVEDVAVGDQLVSFRFWELPALDWSTLAVKHPPRLDVPLDRRYGYNVHAVSLAAAQLNGVRVDGDEEIPLTVQPADPKRKKAAVNEWEDLFDIVSGADLGRIVEAIWRLNEYLPEQRAVDAKKARLAERQKNSPSPEN